MDDDDKVTFQVQVVLVLFKEVADTLRLLSSEEIIGAEFANLWHDRGIIRGVLDIENQGKCRCTRLEKKLFLSAFKVTVALLMLCYLKS